MFNAVDKLGATTFKDTVTAGSSGQIILRTNGAVTATTFTGSGANLTDIEAFPSGTKQVFYQASAPTGWTQDTTAALNEAVMSVVTGSGGGTGGSTAYFSSFLATTNKAAADPDAPVSGSVSGTVGGHTLSTPELTSHKHQMRFGPPNFQSRGDGTPQFKITMVPGSKRYVYPNNTFVSPTDFMSDEGGSGPHSHPFSGSLASATADVSVTVPAADVKYANVIIAAKD